ncbi:helix-turn-helix domain-containing protein [Vibrio owensii]|uniref:helix-turn-helix domain-containing protein n=1 Tax=Vibrio owensii TaxID=696485 RepID=UPI0005F006D0|nr:helix-turn-helix transcriptional regulator [Vibrio owensii]
MVFGDMLRNYRTLNDVTQQQMVDILAVHEDFDSISTVSYHRWESGKNVPSIKKQAKILMILGCNEELFSIAKDCQRALNFLEATISRRWDVNRFGFDYCYDTSNTGEVVYEVIKDYEVIPKEALTLQQRFYANKTECVQVDPEKVMQASKHNHMLIAKNDGLIYGQMWLHVMKASDLRDVFDRMKYNKVQTLASLGISNDEDIVYLSSFHSTRKDVFLTFLKSWLEEMKALEPIPRYTYFRLHAASCNSLIESQFSPILITKGGTESPRVKHVNTEYEWLGYLMPTHLLILSYGSVLKCYEKAVLELSST